MMRPDEVNRSSSIPTRIVILYLIVAGIGVFPYFGLALAEKAWQIFAIAGIDVALGVAALVALRLIRRNRLQAAVRLLIIVSLIAVAILPVLIAGLGLVAALAAVLVTLSITAQTLPTRDVNRLLYASIIVGLMSGLLDLAAPDSQYTFDLIPIIVTLLVGVLLIAYVALLVRQFRTYALTTKLIVSFLGVTMVSIAVVAAFTNFTVRDLLTQEVGSTLQNVARSQAQLVGDLLAKQVDTLQTLGLSKTIQDAVKATNDAYTGDSLAIRAEIEQVNRQWQSVPDSDPLVLSRLDGAVASELKEYLSFSTEYDEVLVTDRYGGLVAATRRPPSYYQAGEDWWQTAFNTGIGAVYIGQPESAPGFAALRSVIALPLYEHGTRRVIGVIRVAYRLQAMAEAISQTRLGSTGRTTLLVQDGNQLLADDATSLQTLDASLQTGLQTIAADGYLETDYGGVLSLISVAPIESSDPEEAGPVSLLGWSVLTHQNRDESLAVIDQQVRSTLLVTIAIAGVMAAAAITLGQVLARPITRLTLVAQKVAGGDLSAQAEVETEDEIGALAGAFNVMTAQVRGLVGTLEQRVEARTQQLRVSADVGRAAASILDPDRLLHEVVNLITDRFGFYYAAVFLIDENGKNAVLREATGEAGRQLKERGHKLEVGGQSMVGYVTAQRKSRIALDVGADSVRFANPLLPNTRSEIALPLAVGNRILGALDVQSTQGEAFDAASASVLQSMADQIAVALNNATSYAESQAAARQSRALYLAGQQVSRLEVELETVVNEMLRVVGETLDFTEWWVIMLDDQRESFTPLASTRPGQRRPRRIADQANNPVMRSALQGETHLINDPEHDPRMNDIPPDQRLSVKFLSVPIFSRGMSIGALTFGRSLVMADLTSRDVEVGRSLSSLITVAIENRGLLEQTRRALADLDAINRRLTGEAWASFARRSGDGGAVWVGSKDQPGRAQWPEVAEALSAGRIAVRSLDGERLGIALPIVLRSATIGALRLSLPKPAWDTDTAAMLESIAEHVAQAAENARLVQEAEERAARERALSESSDAIRRKTDMERILQSAAEELARHLNLERVAVRVGEPEDAGLAHHPNGDESAADPMRQMSTAEKRT